MAENPDVASARALADKLLSANGRISRRERIALGLLLRGLANEVETEPSSDIDQKIAWRSVKVVFEVHMRGLREGYRDKAGE